MQHVLFGQKSIFLGDEAAEALVAYGAHVAQLNTGDSIEMRGINAEGNDVRTTFLLNSGTTLVTESTNIDVPEPDNAGAVAHIRRMIERFSTDAAFFEGYNGGETS